MKEPRRIQRLSDLLINQIAAGEVIERPASVVKELVENSLDAGSTRIVIDLEQGGIELVRVTDDGRGIDAEDLTLAVSSHATSKIHEATDLDRIMTMGFRGEALASILSISRLSIRSRTASNDEAFLIEGEGDVVREVRPEAGPLGTQITCRNLFFNTPARRKFLRTAQTEQTRCLEWIRDLAMSHPGIGFKVTCDGRVRTDLPPEQSARDRVIAVLGKDLASELVEVKGDPLDRGVALWGLAGLPSLARANAKAQHVFLNGRAIRDRSIQHALREAYRGLIEPGRHPTCVLMLEVPPDRVDVNVHPAKLEVRFRDQSLVHGLVHRAVRDALQRSDLTPDAIIDVKSPHAIPAGGGSTFAPSFGRSTGEDGGRSGSSFSEYFQRSTPAQTPIDFERMREALAPRSVPSDMEVPRPRRRLLQVHKSYVITQDEDGIVIVDQHALHERVMFETLCTRVTGGSLESQSLLSPSVVDATREQVDRIEEMGPFLARLGIEAEALGPTQIGVHAFPSFLFERKVDPVPFMEDLFATFERDGFVPSTEEALHEVLDMMACKAAVKAGDQLTDDEIERLLELREQVERSSRCPHGRPTSVRLSIAQIERLFGRR